MWTIYFDIFYFQKNLFETITCTNTFEIKVDNFIVDFENIVKSINKITGSNSNSGAIKYLYQSSDNPNSFKKYKFVEQKQYLL